jgi:Tfp pilus assembly protein PilX
MKNLKLVKIETDEKGFASIVIALVLLIVLGLLTVGFAQISRREQQTSLDKQLSNQAYYAAESGVDDVANDINNGTVCDPSIVTCSGSYVNPANYPNQCIPTALLPTSSSISTANGVAYTCVMVNLTPQSLQFNDTPPTSGQNLSFSTQQPLQSLTINWGSSDGNTNYQPTTNIGSEFLKPTNWPSAPPVLAFSITPTGSGSLTRSNLLKTFTADLYPSVDTGNPSTVSYTTPSGQVITGHCGANGNKPINNLYPCSVTIDNLGGGQNFVLSYIPYYDSPNIYVTGSSTNPPLATTPVTFVGQAVVDVTGQAHNVLKRIQGVLNANGTNGKIVNAPILPGFGVEGADVCKRFTTLPGGSGPTHFYATNDTAGTGTIVDGTSDPCNLNQ